MFIIKNDDGGFPNEGCFCQLSICRLMQHVQAKGEESSLPQMNVGPVKFLYSCQRAAKSDLVLFVHYVSVMRERS